MAFNRRRKAIPEAVVGSTVLDVALDFGNSLQSACLLSHGSWRRCSLCVRHYFLRLLGSQEPLSRCPTRRGNRIESFHHVVLGNNLVGHSGPADEPWEGEGFRLFLTHIHQQKQTAHNLKSGLDKFGVEAFVAHEDIDPGKKWPSVIESALQTCDALIGLLHEGFRDSAWCDQEVGFALGRGIPVVPVSFDLNPYGLCGSVQAVTDQASQSSARLAEKLVSVLLKDERTSAKLAQVIVDRLVDARSYDEANALSVFLSKRSRFLTKDHTERLREAEKVNCQLRDSFNFDQCLSSIENEIGSSAA